MDYLEIMSETAVADEKKSLTAQFSHIE